jgi:hypothetical protein
VIAVIITIIVLEMKVPHGPEFASLVPPLPRGTSPPESWPQLVITALAAFTIDDWPPLPAHDSLRFFCPTPLKNV